MSETDPARPTPPGASDLDTVHPAGPPVGSAGAPSETATGGDPSTSAGDIRADASADAPADAPELARGPSEGDSREPSAAAALPEPIPHAGLRYAALRLLMLGAVGGVLYMIGLRGWLLAITAVLVSGIASLFLFMRQRNDAAVNLEHTVDHWKHRHEQDPAPE